MRQMLSGVTALVLMVCTTTVHAIPVLWTLEDVEFEDGGTASGSFVYDADTDAYSGVAVVSTPGSLFGGGSYGGLLAGGPGDAALVPALPADLTGLPLLQLLFQAVLTNAGGVVSLVDPFDPLVSSSEGTCLDALCTSATFERLMVSGTVNSSTAVVPLPPALLLLASAGAALSVLRRRQSPQGG